MTLQEIIDDSKNIVFFGGAGVSTESGIPDFRSVDGLYNMKYKYPPETILSRTFFMNNTKEFYRFYRDKMIIHGAAPNKAHLKLAELEKAGKLSAVITQNIDGLHYAAGSKNVYELHGTIMKNHCMRCHKSYTLEYIEKSEEIPKCTCGGIIKPDVVLYEESLDDKCITGAVDAIARADTLIIGGTSLVVYPAAGFINYFSGKHLVIINKAATSADYKAELVIREPIGETLGKIKIV